MRYLRVQTGFHIAENIHLPGCIGIAYSGWPVTKAMRLSFYWRTKLRIALFRLREDLKIGIVANKSGRKISIA
ncbi:Uncharacterised protein [Klebsiella pneumoniae]|nr:Uncharacterised protein [Klebsiella pneumoniae]